MICKNCGCVDEPKKQEKIFKNNTKHIEARCQHCNAFWKYLPQEPNTEEVMPFGKYKGKRVSEITQEDYDYAWWCAENLKSNHFRLVFQKALEELTTLDKNKNI